MRKAATTMAMMPPAGPVKQFSDHGNYGEINAHDGGGGKGVREAALEDDVHVHQAVANDGVAEAERNQDQRIDRTLHPRRRHPAQGVGNDVEADKGQTAGEGSGGDPLQLLAQNAAGSATETKKENEGSQDKINSQVDLFDLIEPLARAERGKEIQRPGGDEGMQNKKRDGDRVYRNKLGPEPAATLWKHQGEVHEHGGLQQQRHHVAPVNDPVEGIQLAAVMKTIQDERDQAKNVEMNGARRVPAAHENEQADKEVKEPEDAQIVFNRRRIFLRGSDHRRFKGAAVAEQLVADFRPGTDVEEHAGDVGRAMDRNPANGFDNIPLADAGFGGRRITDDVPGGNALPRVHPGNAVIGKNVEGALLEVQDSENNSRQCE